MNVQCNSFILREALHTQLQMDRFRFVNYQKFVTKRVIIRIVVQSGKIITDKGSKQFLSGTWYQVLIMVCLHRYRYYTAEPGFINFIYRIIIDKVMDET